MQRNRTLARLRAEGIMDMNRELTLPLLPQRIAVVSSEQAAGYRDFVQQLFHNQYGYRFAVTLFAASVQGKNAEQTITEALTQIFERRAEFDAVAVLRGGGSQSDLACFDTYAVASLVAQFPIPVVTGIGHDKDTSVTDSVAHTMLKTPTAAAEFFIEQYAMQERYLEQLRNSVAHVWGQHSERLQARLRQYAMRINVCASKVCSMQAEKITRHLPQRLYAATSQALFYEKNKLQYLEGKLHLLDPHNVLRRGYSLTLLDGKTLRDAQQARQGDTLRTLLSNGEVVSVVT